MAREIQTAESQGGRGTLPAPACGQHSLVHGNGSLDVARLVEPPGRLQRRDASPADCREADGEGLVQLGRDAAMPCDVEPSRMVEQITGCVVTGVGEPDVVGPGVVLSAGKHRQLGRQECRPGQRRVRV